MDPFRNPPADSLAAARLHVQALTECGLSREDLLRALLEDYDKQGTGAGETNANAAASSASRIPWLSGGGAATAGGVGGEGVLAYGSDGRPATQGNETSGHDVGFVQMPDLKLSNVNAHNSNGMLMSHGHDMSKIGGISKSKGGRDAHLSISTRSSGSRASMLSSATSRTSMSSLAPSTRDSTFTASMPLKTSPSTPSLTRAMSFSSATTAAGSTTRAYWCSFCDTKFQRKFDWKRHEDEFHERWKKYPCPSCNRVFWGANTFNQHHRSAHGCTTCPHADRVVRYTKRKRAWACGFCAALKGNRDGYIDHVATHYEAGCTKAHWNHSNAIYGLLHQPAIYSAWKQLLDLTYSHLPKEQQPMFEWEAEVTGHAQGFLENEAPGKLQDYLEFFSEGHDDPVMLARMAHDQAKITYRHKIPEQQQQMPPPPPPSQQQPQHIPQQQPRFAENGQHGGLVAAIATATAAAVGNGASASGVGASIKRPVSEPPKPAAVTKEKSRMPSKRHLSAPLMDGLRSGLYAITGQQQRRGFGRSHSHSGTHTANTHGVPPSSFSAMSSPISPAGSPNHQPLGSPFAQVSHLDPGVMTMSSMSSLASLPQTIMEQPETDFFDITTSASASTVTVGAMDIDHVQPGMEQQQQQRGIPHHPHEQQQGMQQQHMSPVELAAIVPIELDGSTSFAMELEGSRPVQLSELPMDHGSGAFVGGVTAAHAGSLSPTHHMSPQLQQQHHQQQQQQHHQPMFEDWSSLSPTVVDENFTVPGPGVGWQPGMAGGNMVLGHGR